MLRTCLANELLYGEIDDLVSIDWNAPEIPVGHKQDLLSPLFIIKFLQLLKKIVRKGLRKSYYPVVENGSRIKGKLLVSQTIRQNTFANKNSKTVCAYEEHGLNSVENRILKKALWFCQSYLDNYSKVASNDMAHFTDLIGYCSPAFEGVSDDLPVTSLVRQHADPFYPEYQIAIRVASLLLKRFSYSLSKVAVDVLTTPPFWIDMPKLFDLYVYHWLSKRFGGGEKELSYHFSARGNELDFLVNSGSIKIVVDAKYKPYYKTGINHQDVRQLAGYARLNKVYEQLNIHEDSLISCLIIYPDIKEGLDLNAFLTADLEKNELPSYRKIYKVGIKVPFLQ